MKTAVVVQDERVYVLGCGRRSTTSVGYMVYPGDSSGFEFKCSEQAFKSGASPLTQRVGRHVFTTSNDRLVLAFETHLSNRSSRLAQVLNKLCRGQSALARVWFVALTMGGYGQSNMPPAADSEIVTDRPDITESGTVVPSGSLQFENGLTWTEDRGHTILDLSETLVRFGIDGRSELRVVVPNYSEGLTGRASTSGFGDIALGMKQQLGPLPGDFDLSVIVALSVPTGADRISSHGYDPFTKFPWAKELKRGWSIGGMESLFWYTEDRRRNLTGESTFYIEKRITKPWDVFAEYGGDFQQRGGSKEVAHFGSAYKITPKSQIDFHFGFGLSQVTPDRFFAVGYSFRIDNLWKR